MEFLTGMFGILSVQSIISLASQAPTIMPVASVPACSTLPSPPRKHVTASKHGNHSTG